MIKYIPAHNNRKRNGTPNSWGYYESNCFLGSLFWMFTIPSITLLDNWNVICDVYISDLNKFLTLSAGDSNECQSSDGYLEIERKMKSFNHNNKEKATCLLCEI